MKEKEDRKPYKREEDLLIICLYGIEKKKPKDIAKIINRTAASIQYRLTKALKGKKSLSEIKYHTEEK